MHPRARHFLPWLLLLLFVWVAVKSAWLSDDAYITLRTVSNWLAGFGPVWNVGERVQAYTHPLWLLALTGAVGVTREYFFTTLVLSLALAAGAFAIVVGRLAVAWASALLAVATISTLALAVLPEAFNRPFAIPTGIALMGLGWSAWRRASAPAEGRPVRVAQAV